MTEDAGTPPEEQAAPAEAPAPAEEAPAAEGAAPPSGEGQKNPLSMISMICGIVGLVLSPVICCGISFLSMPINLAAIILGFISLSKIKQDPGLEGAGQSKVGIILGIIGIVVVVAIVVLYFLGIVATSISQQ